MSVTADARLRLAALVALAVVVVDQVTKALVARTMDLHETVPLLPGLRVRIERATGEKCPRCWMVRTLGVDARHPEVCDRCATVLA